MKLTLEELEKIGALEELRFINRGIEKESLRVSNAGKISKKTHPKNLGSALTNPYITTDFSESLLELITPTFNDAQSCLNFLEDIHAFVYKNLEDEVLWPCSMPCPIESEEEIPIGNYGQSNSGMIKTVYRRGLSNRYGSMMQAIAGIHYNFSFSDNFFELLSESADKRNHKELKNEIYLHIARNFKRYGWLYFLLFGASPAACNTFVGKREHDLSEHPSGGLYKENSTSLRMGDLGYISKAQDDLDISYNSLDEYCSGLKNALNTTYDEYQKIGEHKEGNRIQLNTSVIQIENEYYSTIRPKRVCPSGERPINVLKSEGIDYLELRCVDLDPFSPIGIEREQIDFMDSFILFCLLEESPEINKAELENIKITHDLIVNRGREVNKEIVFNGQAMSILESSNWILSKVKSVASTAGEVIFKNNKENKWEIALDSQIKKLTDLSLTPSKRILDDMDTEKKSFKDFGTELSLQHSHYFKGRKNNSDKLFLEAAKKSISDQAAIESSEEVDFETFLKGFLNQTA
jgi:glutamate--cysteine ligase|tara:strand:+ start:13667 stop:15229 length:1563 start_codon:yes stop_codon:yes gene_type:complete